MTTIRAVVVDPDGAVRDDNIENSLDSFQGIVDGYIEVVYGNEALIYVNEEGLILGLPFNPLATLFANRVLGFHGKLFGVALIVGPSDSEGNDTPVRQIVVDYFTKEI